MLIPPSSSYGPRIPGSSPWPSYARVNVWLGWTQSWLRYKVCWLKLGQNLALALVVLVQAFVMQLKLESDDSCLCKTRVWLG